MKCPLDHATLVDYWTGDLTEAETEWVDEHLFSCGACFEAAGKVASLASALRDAIPPVAVERDLERLRARGVVINSNDFLPGEVKEAWLRRGADLLIHRLILEDPDAFEQASLEFETLDGAPLFTYSDVPVDRMGGAVLIACRRHFMELVPEPDMRVRVRGTSSSGAETTAAYTVLHRFE